MCDDDVNPWLPADPSISRRTFGVGVAAAVGLTAAEARAQAAVTEKDVTIKTPDGESDAALYYPSGKGTWPAVLVWPDIGGLRPVFRDLGRRLASQGYVVLVVNPFYRSAKAPETALLSFGTPEGRQKQTNKKKMAGVQGYCMGGPLSFQTAGSVPQRIGAVASFHGGGLVTKDASSPHLLVAKTKASYLVAVAKNDDARAPDEKEVLRKTFAEAKRPATVEVYGGDHGWCVKGSQVYNEAEAERAWAELSKLYKSSLA